MTLAEDVAKKAKRAAKKAVRREMAERAAKATARHPVSGRFTAEAPLPLGEDPERDEVARHLTEAGVLGDRAVKAAMELDRVRARPHTLPEETFAAEQSSLANLRLHIESRRQGAAAGRFAKSSEVSPLAKSISQNIEKMRRHAEGLPAGDPFGSAAERAQHAEKEAAVGNLDRVRLAARSVSGVASKGVEVDGGTRALAEQRDSIASIRAAQAMALTPAIIGPASQNQPRQQLQALLDGTATAQSLGSPAGANMGDFARPSVHDEPPIQGLRKLESEYQQAGDPVEKARVADQLSRQRLRMTYEGFKFAMKESNNNGDVTPELVSAPTSASDLRGIVGTVRPEYVNAA